MNKINTDNSKMNAKVRRYEPYFSSLSTTRSLRAASPQSNQWRHHLSPEVDKYYQQLQRSPSTSQTSVQILRMKSTDKDQVNFKGSMKSIYTQSEMDIGLTTPSKRRPLQIHKLQSLATTINRSQRQDTERRQKQYRQKQIEKKSEKQLKKMTSVQREAYYSYRMNLLQEQCIYLRHQFIKHCLKHHRKQFQN